MINVLWKQNLYFQTQNPISNMCAIHMLNNLLGSKVFIESHFRQVSQRLKKDHPESKFSFDHALGLGDYDVSIIISLLSSINLQHRWLDKRAKHTVQQQIKPFLIGYILNIEIKPNFFKQLLSLSSKHWICVRYVKQDNAFYLFDSKQKQIQKLSSIQQFLEFMRFQNATIIQVTIRKNFILDKAIYPNLTQIQSKSLENENENEESYKRNEQTKIETNEIRQQQPEINLKQ